MNKNKKLLVLLVMIICSMTIFAFANQELYRLFCEAIGLNVSVEQEDSNLSSNYDKTARDLSITFTTETMHNVPIKFDVKTKKTTVKIGYLYENYYSFKNLTKDTIYFRPVHRVYPPEASNHYKMVKCFCFDDMVIFPKEELDLPLSFLFSSDLSPDVHSVIMHYTLVKRLKEDVMIEEEIE